MRAFIDNLRHRTIDETLLSSQRFELADAEKLDLFYKPELVGVEDSTQLPPPTMDDLLFGHESTIRKFCMALASPAKANHILLLGQNGTGKSFLLDQVVEWSQHEAQKIRDDPDYAEGRRAELREAREGDNFTRDENLFMFSQGMALRPLIDQAALYNFTFSSKPHTVVLPQGAYNELHEDLLQVYRLLNDNGARYNKYTGINEGKVAVLRDEMEVRKAALEGDTYKIDFEIERVGISQGRPVFTVHSSIRYRVPEEDKPAIEVRTALLEKLVEDFMEEISEQPLLSLKLQNIVLHVLKDAEKKLENDEMQAACRKEKRRRVLKNKEIYAEHHAKILDKYRRAIRQKVNFGNYVFSIEPETVLALAPDGEIVRNSIHGEYFHVTPPTVSKASPLTEEVVDAVTRLGGEYRDRINEIIKQSQFETIIYGDSKNEARAILQELQKKWLGKVEEGSESHSTLEKWFGDAIAGLRTLPSASDPNVDGAVVFLTYLPREIQNNADTIGYSYDGGDGSTLESLLGTAQHDAKNMTPEHMRCTSGSFHRTHGGITKRDELKEFFQKESQWTGALTVMQTGKASISGGRNENNGSTSAIIETEEAYAAATFVGCANYDVIPLISPQMARRLNIIEISSVTKNTPENLAKAARWFGHKVNHINADPETTQELPPLSQELMAYLANEAVLRSGSDEHITTRLAVLERDMVQAATLAMFDGATFVTSEYFKRAENMNREASREKEEQRVKHSLENGTLSFSGFECGRINATAVMSFGDDADYSSYGIVNPMEAAVGRGRKAIRLGENETKQVGKSTQKGFQMNLEYLLHNFGKQIKGIQDLDAMVVHPTTTSEYDGNSASLASLLLIYSAVTELELDQSKAVTGAIVGKDGKVGPIGGIYEKAHAVYTAAKLSDQLGESTGFVFPQSNLKELLRHVETDTEFKEAIETGQFNLYPVDTVEQAINTFMGQPKEYVDRRFVRNARKLLS